MGDALMELEQILRSNNLTREEEDILSRCKAKVVKNFSLTAILASGLVWTATRKLSYGYRINLSGGAGIFSGFWTGERSLNSCVNHILALDGTRMQNELTKIIVTKHRDNARAMQIVKKHFYSENVLDDTHVDTPLSRWRYRNQFGESVAQSQRTEGSDTYDASADLKPRQSTDPSQFTEPRQFSMNAAAEVTGDPFDGILGYSEPHQEIPLPDTSPTDIASKRRARRKKRAQRHRRTHSTEVSTD